MVHEEKQLKLMLIPLLWLWHHFLFACEEHGIAPKLRRIPDSLNTTCFMSLLLTDRRSAAMLRNLLLSTDFESPFEFVDDSITCTYHRGQQATTRFVPMITEVATDVI